MQGTVLKKFEFGTACSVLFNLGLAPKNNLLLYGQEIDRVSHKLAARLKILKGSFTICVKSGRGFPDVYKSK